jgi:predicted porin
LNYEGNVGPLSLLAGASYETGRREEEGSALTSPTTAAAAGLYKGRREAYQVGFDVGFAGFHAGALYFRDDHGIRNGGDQKAWSVGLTYTMGPLTVGANYYDSWRSVAAVTGAALPDERLSRLLVGARYVLGPGVDIRTSAQNYNYRAPSGLDAADNDSWFFVLGTNFTF